MTKTSHSLVSTHEKWWNHMSTQGLVRVEKREPSCTVGGNVNWYSHYGGSLKTKNRTTIWPSNPTPGHIPRENHNSERHMHPNVHCSTIYNSQDMEQPKCPSTDEWIKKMWHIYIVGYSSAIKETKLSYL